MIFQKMQMRSKTEKFADLILVIGLFIMLAGCVGFIIWGSIETFVYVMDVIKRVVWGR